MISLRKWAKQRQMGLVDTRPQVSFGCDPSDPPEVNASGPAISATIKGLELF